MQTQFQYIADLAKQYNDYSEKQNDLFTAINSLPKNVVEEIYREYGDPDRDFKPVNLLRAEIARRLDEGELVDEKILELIKDKIRVRDTYFFASFSNKLKDGLINYKETKGKGDYFTSWKDHWKILYVFFFRGQTKETVNIYLQQIGNDLKTKLNLNDYDLHTVDFNGPSNFGSTYCWIALYSFTKYSHKDSYQFFLRIDTISKAGLLAGWSIKDPKPDKLKWISTYDEALFYLRELKPEITKLNKASRNYFKFSTGSQASEWERFYKDGIAAVDYSSSNFGDISKANSIQDINKVAGLPADSQSNQVWNLWLFKSANNGDVVFANKGVNTCLGIGIIKSDYYFDEKAGGYNHRRKINWITDKVYQYKPNSLDYPTHEKYKTLFRPDTFSPIKVYEFLLNEYVRLYPELASIFLENNLKFNSNKIGFPSGSETEEEIEADSEENEPLNFWWVNANPKIWSISNHIEGQRQSYTTHNEKGNKRRIYKYFEAVKQGDLIIGYESTPTKQIKAIYEVTKGIHNTEDGEEIEFELVEKLEIPVHWNDLKNNPALQHCEVFINNQGSLFKLTEDEYDIIREIIDNKNIITEKLIQSSNIKKYKFTEDTEKPFINESDFLQTVALLKRKKKHHLARSSWRWQNFHCTEIGL